MAHVKSASLFQFLPTLGTVKHFKVAALLNMSLHEFAHNAREVNDMITSLVNESGLILNSSKVSEYNHKQ